MMLDGGRSLNFRTSMLEVVVRKRATMDPELLKDGYSILAGIPAHRFVRGLIAYYGHGQENAHWHGVEACNTLACGAGWLALFPPWKCEGNSQLLEKLLGLKSPAGYVLLSETDVFTFRGASPFDHEGWTSAMTDKELLLYRIRRHLGEGEFSAARAALEDARGESVMWAGVEGGKPVGAVAGDCVPV